MAMTQQRRADPTDPIPEYTPSPQTMGQPAAVPVGPAALLRRLVIARMQRFSVRHASTAWGQRYRDPISPHGIALFYAWQRPPATPPPDHKPPAFPSAEDAAPRYQLGTATRLFLAEPEADELPNVLHTLIRFVREESRTDPRWTPLVHMDRAETMPPEAGYFGIGVSTLDTPAGRWADIQKTASSERDIPGSVLIVLDDWEPVRIHCERAGERGYNLLTVESTGGLDPDGSRNTQGQEWRWMPDLLGLQTPDWRFLDGLHQAITEGIRGRHRSR